MASPLRLVPVAAAIAACGSCASAQIISAVLPPATAPGQKRDRVSIHIMETPLARWDYREVYLSRTRLTNTLAADVYGIISGHTDPGFMLAGEVAVALGGGHWSLTAGGWHNALGRHDFDFDAVLALGAAPGSAKLEEDPCRQAGTALCGDFVATAPLSLTMYEAHVGLFYKAAGIQFGFVRTHQGLNQFFVGARWTVTFPGEPFPVVIPLDSGFRQPEDDTPGSRTDFHKTTTDFTVFGVFRRSEKRWGLSAGVGAYFKEGIPEGSPLRFGGDETVPSAFVTANVNFYRGLGIDLSYWYVGKTRTVTPFAEAKDLRVRSDAQSRLVVGVGFSF